MNKLLLPIHYWTREAKEFDSVELPSFYFVVFTNEAQNESIRNSFHYE